MFGPISTVYLVQALMATEPQIGGLNSLAFAIRIMASPVLGWIAAKKGVKRIMLLGFSLGFLYPLAFTLAADVSHLVPVYVLSGFFWSCINAGWFAWQMELIPRERGVYAGLLSFINGMAWALGPFLGGLLGDAIGLQLSAIISSAAVLAGLLILSKVPERLEVAPAQP
jgi:MFS family permease